MKKCEFEQLTRDVAQEVYDHGYSIAHMGSFLGFCKSVNRRFADASLEYDLPSLCEDLVRDSEENCTYERVKIKKRFAKYLISYLTTEKVDFSATTRVFRDGLEPEYDNLLNDYRNHLRDKGMSKSTVLKWDGYAYRFLRYLQDLGLASVAEIDTEVVDGFLNWVAKMHASSGMAGELTMLRSFLGYTDKCGRTRNACHVVPQGRYVRSAPVPALTDSEVDWLVSAIDNSKPLGKRDLAIILLALDLGLRSSEIISLKMSDIDWDKSTINVFQVKTKNPICLPLTDDVTAALADYLLHGRPESMHTEVFLRMVAPWDPIKKSSSLWNILKKYFVKAGLSRADKDGASIPIGPHRLRHFVDINVLWSAPSLQGQIAL